MPLISVISLAELEQRAVDAYTQAHDAAFKVASAQWKRAAAELAGNDETLHRVLLARLHDAYLLGQRSEMDARLAEDDARAFRPEPVRWSRSVTKGGG